MRRPDHRGAAESYRKQITLGLDGEPKAAREGAQDRPRALLDLIGTKPDVIGVVNLELAALVCVAMVARDLRNSGARLAQLQGFLAADTDGALSIGAYADDADSLRRLRLAARPQKLVIGAKP